MLSADAERAETAGDTDVAAKLFDRADRPERGGLLAQAGNVFSEEPGDLSKFPWARGEVEAHDEGKKQAIAGAVGAVRGSADRIFQGVDHRDADI